jgi:arylsulfatase
LVLALPYVAASLLLLIWVSRFRLDAALLSKDGLVVAASAGGFVLVALAFFYLAGHGRVGRAAALFPVIAVLLAPLVAPLVAARFEPRYPGGSTPEQTQKAVFLITIDSLRADVLSCYGSERVQTQHIDRLAQDGILFENAISASSWTLPSVASFMTGVSPLIHGATAWQARLPDRFKTLAEYFKEAGYRTMAIGQNPVLDPARNVNQGFDEYQWISAETRHPAVSIGKSILGAVLPRKAISFTEEITDAAIARLGIASEGPVFYWIHYFDPHLPYAPPAAYLSEAERANPMGMEFNEFERVRMGRFGGRQEERDWIRSLYEGEVRFVDDEFGRLIEAIKAQGLYEDATFIVSSDHGEEFWDHGGFEHGHTMHHELLRVPLIIKGPAVASPGRVEAPVGTEALAPTILEISGLPYDAASMTSASFTAYLNPSSPPPPPGSVLSFGTLYFDELEAVTTPEFKYIQAVDFGTEKLYNRTVDPLELSPLNVEEHAAAEGARQLLNQAHSAGSTTGTVEKENIVMDAATEESLRALGYID